MNKKQENKKENKKSFWLFALMMVLALVGGGLFGYWISSLEEAKALDSIAAGLNWFNTYVMPYGTVFFFAVMLISFFPLYGKAKKLFKSWDGEDESIMERAEGCLNAFILISNICQILGYFSMGAGFIGFKNLLNSDADFSSWGLIRFAASTAGMFTMLFCMVMTQRRVIDLVKEMNPEKHGSIYDLHFQKKWEASCDEAEKMIIYKAAWKAYQAASLVCQLMWLAMVLGSLIFNLGVLPLLCVTVIWLTLTVTYCAASMKLGKPSAGGLSIR